MAVDRLHASLYEQHPARTRPPDGHSSWLFRLGQSVINGERSLDYTQYNRQAWDHQVKEGNRWTIPVTSEIIAAVRDGDWNVVLTPQKPVPRSWFPNLGGLKVLGLASGGGQQAPIFAAAGADVTVIDSTHYFLCGVSERQGGGKDACDMHPLGALKSYQ